MTDDDAPRTPALAYRQIIDQLVAGSESLEARLVRTEGVLSKAPEQQAANQFVARLNSQDRATLAAILTNERQSAIHDVLATLSWWIDCREVALTYQGDPMPVDVSGQGMHGDYVGRLTDWPWPPAAG